MFPVICLTFDKTGYIAFNAELDHPFLADTSILINTSCPTSGTWHKMQEKRREKSRLNQIPEKSYRKFSFYFAFQWDGGRISILFNRTSGLIWKIK